MKNLTVNQLPDGDKSKKTPCDQTEKCGEMAKFSIEIIGGAIVHMCPSCYLKWQARLTKVFGDWFRSH